MTMKPSHLVLIAVSLLGVFCRFPLAQTMPTTGTGTNQIRFNEMMVADISGRNLESGGIYTYKSEDGPSATRSILTFRTPELALREFDSMVRKATKIINKSEELPNNGITRRWVLLMRRTAKERTRNVAVASSSGLRLGKSRS